MRLTQGVIIDIDGVLVDSNGARAQAWLEALKGQGHHATYAEVCKLQGLVPSEVLIRTAGLGLDTGEGQAIYERYLHIFRRRLLDRLVPFYRAKELVERLAMSGLRLAVASIDPPEVLLRLLKTCGAEMLYHPAESTGAATDNGSNRDVIKSALDRLGASPPQVVMIADSPFDIDAAAHMNVPVIALETGGWNASELSRAIAVYRDADHLLSELPSSPVASLLVHGQPMPLA